MAAINQLCEPDLEMTAANMVKEMDKFSRTFDITHYANAQKIKAGLGASKLPAVTSWELYDKAFAWPRVRRYEVV